MFSIVAFYTIEPSQLTLVASYFLGEGGGAAKLRFYPVACRRLHDGAQFCPEFATLPIPHPRASPPTRLGHPRKHRQDCTQEHADGLPNDLDVLPIDFRLTMQILSTFDIGKIDRAAVGP